MKHFFVLTSFLFFWNTTTAFAQEGNSQSYNVSIVDDKDTETCVILDRSIKVNDVHPLMDQFEAESENYITWLYSLNKIWQMDSTFLPGPKVITKESLVFTITKNGKTRFDTLNNAVDPDKYIPNFEANGSWISKTKRPYFNRIDIEKQGSLPRGSMSYIEAKRKKMECGVLVAKPRSKVTVLIKNLKGETLTVLCDEYRLKGWSNFKWKRGGYPRGKYLLSFEVDGQLMTQKFKI